MQNLQELHAPQMLVSMICEADLLTIPQHCEHLPSSQILFVLLNVHQLQHIFEHKQFNYWRFDDSVKKLLHPNLDLCLNAIILIKWAIYGNSLCLLQPDQQPFLLLVLVSSM